MVARGNKAIAAHVRFTRSQTHIFYAQFKKLIFGWEFYSFVLCVFQTRCGFSTCARCPFALLGVQTNCRHHHTQCKHSACGNILALSVWAQLLHRQKNNSVCNWKLCSVFPVEWYSHFVYAYLIHALQRLLRDVYFARLYRYAWDPRLSLSPSPSLSLYLVDFNRRQRHI